MKGLECPFGRLARVRYEVRCKSSHDIQGDPNHPEGGGVRCFVVPVGTCMVDHLSKPIQPVILEPHKQEQHHPDDGFDLGETKPSLPTSTDGFDEPEPVISKPSTQNTSPALSQGEVFKEQIIRIDTSQFSEDGVEIIPL